MSGVPAGQLDTGTAVFDFGRRPTPKETSFGAGVRGVENGCAIPVDVAGGGFAASVAGEKEDFVDENGRATDGKLRRADARRIHREQIIVVVEGCFAEVFWRELSRYFLEELRLPKWDDMAANIKVHLARVCTEIHK